VGCDESAVHVGIDVQISIHAPTWGATANFEIKRPEKGKYNQKLAIFFIKIKK
jgi:hypothetical protein